MNSLERQVDQIITITLDIREKVQDLDQRVGRLEYSFDKSLNKMDEFLGILQRHDVEILSLRNAYNRLSGIA